MNPDGTLSVQNFRTREHAQELLGEIVSFELPEAERLVNARDEIANVDSLNAASDIHAPRFWASDLLERPSNGNAGDVDRPMIGAAYEESIGG